MSKKIIALVLALLVGIIAIALTACNPDDNGTTTTANADNTGTTADSKIIVGFDSGMPPVGFTDENGEFVGFDIDCAKAVAEYLNMEIELKPIDWTKKDTALEAGEIDCIWNGFTITTARETQYEWTRAYMENKQVVVVLADSSYKTFDDLKDKVCGAQKSSTAVDAIEENEEFKNNIKGELVLKDTNVLVLQDLKAGVTDFAVTDLTLAEYMMTQNPDTYKLLDESLADEVYGVGFLLGNTALRDKVQGALDALYEDGTLVEISNEWFGRDVFINMPEANDTSTSDEAA